MMILKLDITTTAQQAALALLSPPLRGLLAAGVCAAWAAAVGLGLTVVDWVERKAK